MMLKKKKMMKKNNLNLIDVNETIKVDLANKILGRISTQIADLLRGKNKVTYVPNKVIGAKIIAYNASKIVFSGRKTEQKIYYHHSGYIGSLKAILLKDLFLKNPSEVLKKSVFGMLPKNRLRKHWMKNLVIHNGEINE